MNNKTGTRQQQAEAKYDRKFKNGEIPIRMETILVGGQPVELINASAIASRSGWNRTRLRDWEQHAMIPPPIRIRGVRYFTERQIGLMMRLAELSTKRRPTLKERAFRDRFIRELWRRWWE